MNKEEMLAKIEEIPTFIKRDVAVKDFKAKPVQVGEEAEQDFDEVWEEKDSFKAITEAGETEPLAFVSSRYQLVQFKDMFKPIVEKINDFEGNLEYYHGWAIMDIFPADEEFDNDGNKIGIVAYNSVDRTSALNIRFCVGYGDKVLTIPKNVASFRKMHLGNVGQMTQDYIEVITKIKSAWESIVNQFTQMEVLKEDVKQVGQNFKIDDRAIKYMTKKIENGKEYNMWSFCMEVFAYFSNRKYKSPVHRRKKLDTFVENIFKYNTAISI